MTLAKIEEIILRMESEGFRVRGVTFDLGNKTFLKNLQNLEKHYFQNPYDDTRKVFLFPDVPHLIKLCRNHLLDKGKYFFFTNRAKAI